MYCAVITYCLAALVYNKLKVDLSIYEILQILSISLLGITPIKEILTMCDYNNVKELQNKRLLISGFLRPPMRYDNEKIFFNEFYGISLI